MPTKPILWVRSVGQVMSMPSLRKSFVRSAANKATSASFHSSKAAIASAESPRVFVATLRPSKRLPRSPSSRHYETHEVFWVGKLDVGFGVGFFPCPLSAVFLVLPFAFKGL